jgi:hypothetical protein
MRKILLVAAATSSFAFAHQAAGAQDLTNVQLAQASTAPADPAPAAPAAAPAPQPAPAAQAAPDAGPPTAKAPKHAKKRVAKRRSWESDEAKARGIAAKYGVTW